MLAFIYLIAAYLLGDALCRRFFRFISIPHRAAASFLTGILISTLITYGAALLFAKTSQPLIWANLTFLLVAGGIILLLRRNLLGSEPGDGFIKLYWLKLRNATRVPDDASETLEADIQSKTNDPVDTQNNQTKTARWDWLVLGIWLVCGLLIFSNLQFTDGNFEFSGRSWSDFGPHLSLAQSFALGNNFPTEHPFFAGEVIRYHFLFWFLAANLSYLGLNLVFAVNFLSLLSLISLLALIQTLAEVLFGSRVVGRIATIFFFLSSSSLAYIPFLASKSNTSDAFQSIFDLRNYINTGYSFWGDSWGALSAAVFANQRHLLSSVGILLIIIIYIVDFYRRKGIIPSIGIKNGASESETGELPAVRITKVTRRDMLAMIFCGTLIGLMPYWNSAIFVSAFIVLGGCLVFFAHRRYLFILLTTAFVLSLPQVYALKAGHLNPTGQSLFQFGFTLTDPTIYLVIEYVLWTIGFKWLVLAIALFFLPGPHRRLFLAFLGLIPVVFLFRLSTDAFNNHKLLNVWIVLTSVYAAYALWVIGRKKLYLALGSILLALLMVCGAIIDLVPFFKDTTVTVPYTSDPLTTWLQKNTRPHDVFLSDHYVSHPITFSGRKLFWGSTTFLWTAGYDMSEREKVFKQIFKVRDPQQLIEILNANNISYVAIDEALRNNQLIKPLDASIIENNFEMVFKAENGGHGNLSIYKVPSGPSVRTADQIRDEKVESTPPISAFEGGRGNGYGQFAGPRGIAVDAKGNFYVSDTDNGRIQVFSPDGAFISTFGAGLLEQPNGIVIDVAGNIYVADAAKRQIMGFTAEGKPFKEITNPESTFFGPRGLAIGPNGLLYLVDQGNSRIVAIDPESDKTFTWGQKGSENGEFLEPTGIEVAEDRVYVTDNLNNRVQVFTLEGKFIGVWPVPEWENYPWQSPDAAFDPQTKRFYITSPRSKEILVFDLEGNRLQTLKPAVSDALDNPGGLAVSDEKRRRRLYVANTGRSNVYFFELNTEPEKIAK